MAKQRYINTKFWSDTWVQKLDPIEKLFYLYLLTNEKTNIAGVYELPLKIMAVETGIEEDTILNLFKRFKKFRKVFYVDGWVIIANFPKHQNWKGSPKIKQGIELILCDIPAKIIKGMHTLSIPYTYPLNYSNTNSNTNSNNNSPSDRVSFKKKKKPFFNGNPMRKVAGRWKVVKDGEWLEFAGEKSDIKWQ